MILSHVMAGVKKLTVIFHIVVPLFFGIIIYALWRGIFLIDPTQRIFPMAYWSMHPNWLLYNLPDGLWFYALLSAIAYIWKDNRSIYFIMWLIFASTLAFLSEFLQLFHFIAGTFDYYDLLAYSIAILIFYCYNFKQVNQPIFLHLNLKKNEPH